MIKRLVVLLPNIAGGGAEIVAIEQIKYLRSLVRYKVDLVLQVDNVEYDLGDLDYICLGTRNTFLGVWRFFLHCRRKNYDLFIGHMAGPNIIVGIVAKFCGAKSLLNVHSIWTTERGELTGLKNGILNQSYRLALKLSSRIIAVSQGVKQDLLPIVRNKKIDVCYNPLRFHENIDRRYQLKNQLRLKVLLVGRLVDVKRPLEFLKNIAAKAPMIDFIVVGDGPLMSDLREYVKENSMESYVSFTGFVNPKEYYLLGDILCLVSSREGFGNVLIEAMYHYCMVISFDINSGPFEILKKNEFGIILPQEDWEGLLSWLLKIHRDRSILQKYKHKGRLRSLDYMPEVVFPKLEASIASTLE